MDVIAAAASDHRGEAELWLPPSGGGSRGVSSLHRRDIHGTSIKVPLVTVDGLGLRNVTFMKIDVDGREVPVLRGAADTIRRDQPRLLVEVEERDPADHGRHGPAGIVGLPGLGPAQPPVGAGGRLPAGRASGQHVPGVGTRPAGPGDMALPALHQLGAVPARTLIPRPVKIGPASGLMAAS